MKIKLTVCVMLISLMALGFVFVGCDSDNGGGGGGGGVTEASVLGTWLMKVTKEQYIQALVAGNIMDEEGARYFVLALEAGGVKFPAIIGEFELKANHTYVSYDIDLKTDEKTEAESGSWSLNGNTLN
jgi:hypothetical protein